MNNSEKIHKLKISYYQIGIIVCSLVCTGVYIWSILSASEYSVYFEPDIGFYYLFKYLYLTAAGAFGMYLWAGGSGKYRKYFLPAALAVLTIYCISISWMGYAWQYAVKELCLALWPFFTYIAAARITDLIAKRKRWNYLVGMGLYFISLCLSIWVIEEVMVPSEFYRRDPVEMAYMLITGSLSWIVVGKGHWEDNKKEKTRAVLVFSLISCMAVFWDHERIWSIIRSLANPITASHADVPYQVNWLGYRIQIFLDAWLGSRAAFEDVGLFSRVHNCPLFWIKYQKGWPLSVVVFTAGLILIYCVMMGTKRRESRENTFIRILLWSLFLRCILGYLAELFLITSTDVGVLLLRNPADILLVCYLVLLQKGEGKNEAWCD